MARFLKVKYVKELAKANGKRVGKDFILVLDAFVQKKIESACAVHDGTRKTLNASIAGYVGLKA